MGQDEDSTNKLVERLAHLGAQDVLQLIKVRATALLNDNLIRPHDANRRLTMFLSILLSEGGARLNAQSVREVEDLKDVLAAAAECLPEERWCSLPIVLDKIPEQVDEALTLPQLLRANRKHGEVLFV